MTASVAPSGEASALQTRITTPDTPIATGTPIPSTAACTGSRARSGTAWYVTLIEVRVVPSVSAMSAMRAAETVSRSAIEPAPAAARTTSIATANAPSTNGLAVMPIRSPNRRSSGPASRNRNAMLAMLMAAV